MEIWLPTVVDGYEVSNLGRVRSIERSRIDKNGFIKRYRGCLLTPGLQGSRYEDGIGYLCVSLGRGKQAAVHILVCTAFHGERPSNNHEVAHFNGNSQDNSSVNVRWATHKENCKDMIRHGTRARGSAHGRSKLSDQQRAEIIELKKAGLMKYAEIASLFGIHAQSVYRIGRYT